MRIPKLALLILVVGTVLGMNVAPIHAQASRTWVSGVGDDANPCSRTAPCKTFAGAISKTAAGGEIDALDPAGFGAVTITKGITIDGGGGQVASVLVSGTNGIVVQAGPSDVVILRNLRINGIGTGINGIRFLAGKALILENLEIFGFTTNGVDVLNAFLNDPNAQGSPLSLATAIQDLSDDPTARSLTIVISGGDDGARPSASDYEGAVDAITDLKTGLKQFEDLEDISIVAAPGSTYGFETPTYNPQARAIVGLLINHAQRMKYRIAVIDSGDNQSIGQVRAMRAQFDSTYSALYYPWIRVLDPLTQREIYAPPSGFVSGIYARNDINRAVYKAPANEVVNLALGFERFLNKSQQEVLNPEGINCFRFFEGRGMRLWGARTMSSDPEWKYVNLRRYFAYLERSIDKGTQWAVFEPNGPQLWGNIRQTISDFLLNEFFSGALLGDQPNQAYFVKCDRSTMTQNDLDNGRLIVLVGVAVVKPAEFVIFRIGQWTADRKV